MRKSLALMVALVLLLSAFSSALAERMNTLEFCELYIKRLVDFEESTGMEIQDFGNGTYSASQYTDGILLADCCAGSLTINADDLSLDSWCDIFSMQTDDTATGMQRTIRAAIAVSALEYSEVDALSIQYIEKTTPVVKAFTEIIQPIMTDMSIYQKLRDTGEKQKIYTGNYTYYLEYFDAGDASMIMILGE